MKRPGRICYYRPEILRSVLFEEFRPASEGEVESMVDRVFTTATSRRTVLKVSALAPAAALLPVALRGVAAQDKISVTMVTDTNGLGDQNFNDLADRGGKKA